LGVTVRKAPVLMKRKKSTVVQKRVFWRNESLLQNIATETGIPALKLTRIAQNS